MKVPDLLHIDDTRPGIRRRKWGRGFSYFDEHKKRISDQELLSRIKNLAIPPAWLDVWICKQARGYLQATGRDEVKRKQYIYHPDWVAYRQAIKFEKMFDFGSMLPQIRTAVEEGLKREQWDQEKVLALTVKLLDEVPMRVGNDYYTKTNQTYGLTTLRRKHMNVSKKSIQFNYRAKSGKERTVDLADPTLIRLIKECSELPGYEVFRYKDEAGKMNSINSQLLNEYIRSISCEKFSCKDFRTWAANSISIESYLELKKLPAEERPGNMETAVVKKVAAQLGNTESVCRNYYIHPEVREAIRSEQVPSYTQSKKGHRPSALKRLYREEAIALAIMAK
jgi:DNA topoisomerase-1